MSSSIASIAPDARQQAKLYGSGAKKLGGSVRNVAIASERTAEAIAKSLDAYRKASHKPGGELERVALRENFTIVTDSARRLGYLSLVIILVCGVAVILSRVTSWNAGVGWTFFVAALLAFVFLLVATSVFVFSRSDMETQSEFIRYSVGRMISAKLLNIQPLGSAVQQMNAYGGSFSSPSYAQQSASYQQQQATAAASTSFLTWLFGSGRGNSSGGTTTQQAAPPYDPAAATAAASARGRIASYLRSVLLQVEQPLPLLGLHRIDKVTRKLNVSGPTAFGFMALLAMATTAVCVATGVRALAGAPRANLRLAASDMRVSADGGATWSSPVPASASPAGPTPSVTYKLPWGGRWGFAVLPGGGIGAGDYSSVIILGGAAPGGKAGEVARYADVWIGTLDAATGVYGGWTNVTHSAPWGARSGMAATRLLDGSLLLVGGRGAGNTLLADVWRRDAGTWAKLSDSAGAGVPGMEHHCMVTVADARITVPAASYRGTAVLVGGGGVWASSDGGATWARRAASTPFGSLVGASLLVFPTAPTGDTEIAALKASVAALRNGFTAAERAALEAPRDEAWIFSADPIRLTGTEVAEVQAIQQQRANAIRDGVNARLATKPALMTAATRASLTNEGPKLDAAFLADKILFEADGGVLLGYTADQATTQVNTWHTARAARIAPQATLDALVAASRASVSLASLRRLDREADVPALEAMITGAAVTRLEAIAATPMLPDLMLVGGASGISAATTSTGRAPSSFAWSSSDGGASWVAAEDTPSPPPAHRYGASAVVTSGSAFVLAGGFLTNSERGDPPAQDVWAATRSGGGAGAAVKLKWEKKSGTTAQLAGRAWAGMVHHGGKLAIIGGEVTGQSDPATLAALGVMACGVVQGAEDVSTDREIDGTTQTLAVVGLGGAAIVSALAWYLYHRYYKIVYLRIPATYVATTTAWGEVLDRTAMAYTSPGGW